MTTENKKPSAAAMNTALAIAREWRRDLAGDDGGDVLAQGARHIDEAWNALAAEALYDFAQALANGERRTGDV